MTLYKQVRSPSTQRLGRRAIASQTERTLVYTEVVSMSLSSGSGNYMFSCNSLYDPNHTGIGAQPLYFDQLMTLYNHYVVVSSRITLNVADTSNRNVLVALYVDDDTSIESVAGVAAQRPGSKYKFKNFGAIGGDTLTTGWNARYTFGGDPLAKAELRGTHSASPSEQSYFTIVAKDQTLSSDPLQFFVKLEYKAVFSELKTVANS